MAITNHERVGKSLTFLREGLQPFVERELKREYAGRWFEQYRSSAPVQSIASVGNEKAPNWDVSVMLTCMWDQWNQVFAKTLGRGERNNISELRDVRHRWAHQNPFTYDDTYRALDTASRLLLAVSAPQGQEVEKMKTEVLRLRFDEQARSEKRKTVGTTVESQVTGTLKPWREVVQPHADVASGRYQQAEFAADLWQVHLKEGASEYREPKEFFRRTFMTESLTRLLIDAVRRLGANAGDPVVQLQTNFGGGKTHSMLALYHLFSGAKASELLGVDTVLKGAEASQLPANVRRIVIVGNKISPGNPARKPDGTEVRTLWGELAWQLGGKPAYDRIKADDERATNPGDVLRELLNQYGPALILIDEWVAYARQLSESGDLPGGSFETQFSFAQALTESAKLAKNCLLVISLPASDSGASPHAQADEIEVGGQRGREALERLRNVIGRVESSWRPATAEEGFEIVRRRLFEPMTAPEQFKFRDVVADSFYNFYRTQKEEFPLECRNGEYEGRLKAAYPIHPEVFDRLYSDWSTLAKFQRTRGVLRLMASVIHSLWERNDRNPLILPCNIPIDDQRVQFELTRYLPDNWVPVIEKDVDGAQALPLRIDADITNLGKFQACRRVARTIYLGSAPIATAANRGIEDRRIKLGCVMPGESPAIFGDALRRLSAAATYLYPEGARYWYSTQPTVTKLAEDRAERLRRDPDKIAREIEARVKTDVKQKGDFSRTPLVFPQSGTEVADDLDCRLVVLGPEQPYAKEPDNLAEAAAKQILAMRGTAPRLYQNSLVFLAADRTKLADLDEGVRKYLAWKSVVDDAEVLSLSTHQRNQAIQQRESAQDTIIARLPEAYQWLIVPIQQKPSDPMQWQVTKIGRDGSLAERASKKLGGDELLLTVLAPTRLRMELDNIPLWSGNHVSIANLVDFFARYTYLPRLRDSRVLVDSIQRGVALLTWRNESYAYADSYDDATDAYRGLVTGQQISIATAGSAVLVKPDAAAKQRDAESAASQPTESSSACGPSDDFRPGASSTQHSSPTPKALPKRFFGSVRLDSTRVGRDAGRIADEVLSHISGLIGSTVRVNLEIEATIPSGTSEEIVRIVTENARTLKFDTQGFESE